MERVTSIINLGLLCIGMMKKEGTPKYERAIQNANNLKALREPTKDMY